MHQPLEIIENKDVKDAGSTKERILGASLGLFSERGFEAVSVRDIADEIGIGNSALYKHFENKQEIMEMLVDDISERYRRDLLEAAREVETVEGLKELCLKLFRFITEDAEVSGLLKILLMEQYSNPVYAVYYNELFVKLPLSAAENVLSNLKKKKLIKCELPLTTISNMIYLPVLARAATHIGRKRGLKELSDYFDGISGCIL